MAIGWRPRCERVATRDVDGGAVTVEVALGLCSLLVVFAFVLTGVAAVTAQLRCTDAAGAAARYVARGNSQQAQQVVERVAPAGAELTTRQDDEAVTVTVEAQPAGGLIPGVELRGEAYAMLEPGTAPQPAGRGDVDANS